MKQISLIILALSFLYFVNAQDYTISNLGVSKKHIREYINSGQYEKDQKKAIDDAILVFDNLKIPGMPLVIFDIDETALSNLEYELKYDFGFESQSWHNWILSSQAPALKEVKRLYDTLLSRNINIAFMTGRSESQYSATLHNLKSAGYTKFDTLICKSQLYSGKKAIDYKSDVRRILSQKYNIIASVGDQWSDLDGGYTILKIKIPNPYYFLD
ncbi:MAG TPA: HAD family acid phosphatase [Candidatus Kapabacteria bacterium]|nr:HAD family acid phosphatase [Candidatus Kapabacteria bacterium]